MSRELLFSLTKKDFQIQFYKGSGKGGQHRNKVETGVRITHPASGAVAEDCTSRSQHQNKKKAFLKLLETPEFKKWHKIECAKAMGRTIDIEKWVEEQMALENLLIEGVE